VVAGEPVLLPVRAFAVSATLQPRTISELFAADAKRVRITKTRAVARYGDSGWVVAHDFGALVFIGVDDAESSRVMKALVAQLGTEPRAPLEETFAVEVSPGAVPAVRFDRVVVGELDVRVVEILALVIAQSVGMEYYEGDVDALVARLEQWSLGLAASGRLRGSTRDMLRFIGRGMSMRTEVVHTLSLLDSPGATWENEELDRLYRGLGLSFEIQERYRALDHQLNIVQDNLALLIDMVRGRRSILLEVAVAVLVGGELIILLGQLLLGWK
jgi:uncharacterized Rmd1/YagE family protein